MASSPKKSSKAAKVKVSSKSVKSSSKSSRTKKGKANAEKSSKRPLKTVSKPVHFVGLIIWPRFLRNSVTELKMVTWPSWKLSRSLTIAVLIFAVIFAVLIGLVDWGLDKAFKELFLK